MVKLWPNSTSMEELQRKFDELAEKDADYESDICDAICSLERATFNAVEKGKEQLEIAEERLKQMDALITEAFMLHPLSDEVNERFTQCLMSFQPRMESFIEQLKNLIANPPTESTYPKIDDREIFPHEEEEEEGHDEDIENNHTSDTNHDPATENSDL